MSLDDITFRETVMCRRRQLIQVVSREIRVQATGGRFLVVDALSVRCSSLRSDQRMMSRKMKTRMIVVEKVC